MEAYPERYHVLRPEFINKIKSFARFVTHRETELCLSEHHRDHESQLKPTDQEYQPQLPLDPHAVSEGWLAFDDQSNYHTGDL